MKLKTLAALCKREGVFNLYDQLDADGRVAEQWLGTHGAIYPLRGIPFLTEKNIPALFDLPQNKIEIYSIKHSQFPGGYNYYSHDSDEVLMLSGKTRIVYKGAALYPLVLDDSSIEFIKENYLSPLADISNGLDFYERRSTSGKRYFTVKAGLEIVGIILPMKVIDSAFVGDLEALTARCRMVLFEKNSRDMQLGLGAKQREKVPDVDYEADDESEDEMPVF